MQPKRNEPFRLRLLEIGITAALFVPVFFFGGVPAWSEMSAYAVVFSLLIFSPFLIEEYSRLPQFFFRAMAVLLLWLVLQSFFFSENPFAARMEILRFIGTAVLFLAVLHLDIRGAEYLLIFFALAGAAEAFYGIFQANSGSDKILWVAKKAYAGFATGTYVNRNHLAGFLELCMGVQLGLLLNSFFRNRWMTFLAWLLAFFLCLYALLKTGSRMGMMAFGISFLIYFLILLIKDPKNGFAFFLSILPVIAAAVFFKWHMIHGRFYDVKGGLWSLQGRISVWESTWPMIQDHIWTGTGLGVFEWVFPRYQPAGNLLGWSHAHNDYLELAAGLGLPAFCLLVVAFMRLLGYVIPKMSNCHYQLPYALSWGALLGVSSFLIHGFADFNFAIPANRLAFFVCLGLAIRVLKDYRHEYEK